MEWISNFVNTLPGAIILLLIGFVFLVKGADFFVDGASSVAKKLHVPSIIIGLTVVAMGTSLPETAVSVCASMAGQNSLAVSNVVGSNIFNIMVVIGFCALFASIAVDKDTLFRDFPFSVACTILLLVTGIIGMSLGRVDGIIFLVIFVGYIVVLVLAAMKARREKLESIKANATGAADAGSGEDDGEEEIKNYPLWLCLIFIVGGGAAIALGGDWVVDSASTIARTFGLSETLIGLTICSVGTSLPELVTSITAAKKNDTGMALGNAVGSCIFNILMVLGLAAVISPVSFIMTNVIDIVILLVFCAIVWLFSWTKKEIKRTEGIIMLLMYIAYIVYICIR